MGGNLWNPSTTGTTELHLLKVFQLALHQVGHVSLFVDEPAINIFAINAVWN